MSDKFKKIINWNNCTVDSLYEILEVYKKESLENCHKDLKEFVKDFYEKGYGMTNLNIKDFYKNYCTLTLAGLTCSAVKDSKNCDRLDLATLKLILMQQLEIFKKMKNMDEDSLEYYADRLFYINCLNEKEARKDQKFRNTRLYSNTLKIMNDEDFDIFAIDFERKDFEDYNIYVSNGELTNHHKGANLVRYLEKKIK